MAAVLALVAGGFALHTFTAPEGASSPEAAVSALFWAMADEDLIGMAEALHPDERDLVVPAVEQVATELERLELASAALDPRGIEGIDIEVSGLELDATTLGDGVVAVEVRAGELATDGDLTALPLGSILQDLVERDRDRDRESYEDAFDPDLSGTQDLTGLTLVARRHGGTWHVSLLYSLAEAIRLAWDPLSSAPMYGAGVEPVGARTPEAAVREAFEAAFSADLQRLIELVPPGEGDVLHDYGPILLREADELDGSDPSVAFEELELSAAGVGDGRAVVTADRYRLVHEDEYGDTMTWAYDGECSTMTWSYDDSWSDEYDEGPYEWSSCPDDASNGFGLLNAFNLQVAGQTFEIVTEHHDGLWYVSPSRTLLASLLGVLADEDADSVERTIRWFGGEDWLTDPPEIWEACGVEQPSLSTDRDVAEDAWEECSRLLPDDYDGPWGLYGPFGGYGSFGGAEDQFIEVGSPEWEEMYPEADEWDEQEWDAEQWEVEEWEPGIECDEEMWEHVTACFDWDTQVPESFVASIACVEEAEAAGLVAPGTTDVLRCSAVVSDTHAWPAEPEEAEACLAELGGP